MSKYFQVDPYNSDSDQAFLAISQSLQSGDVFVYPTDLGYAIGCLMSDQVALEKIFSIRSEKKPLMTFVASSIEMIEPFISITHAQFRQLKQSTPGQYTFILPLNKKGQKNFKKKRIEVGICIPSCTSTMLLLKYLKQIILSFSFKINQKTLSQVDELPKIIECQIDWIVNAGYQKHQEIKIVNFSS